MRKLMQLVDRAKSMGLNLPAIWAYLVKHKADIVAAIDFLLELLNALNLAAGPEPTPDECKAELAANGCPSDDCETIVDATAAAA